ncbi:uncharacterized protein LOC116336606 [Contarinia nasturtii]|uniref:uncharacterized protein LOC116336606 n=1 Tax=Contarinia nasturtii TaxID=265458 RepID=UPI0012D3D328|nr:uncharacterized protein LOC116336606 [Contarinia nasturtii]
MALIKEIINSPQSSNLLKLKQNSSTQTTSACSSKLPDVNAENDDSQKFADCSNPNNELVQVKTKLKTKEQLKKQPETNIESVLKFELTHVRKLIDDAVNNISNSTSNEDVYDQILWMNEQISELRSNTKSYLSMIHQLEDTLRKQVHNRNANEIEIHRLHEEITKQVQNYENLKNQFKPYPGRSNRSRWINQNEFDRSSSVIYEASLAGKMNNRHLSNLKRNAVEYNCGAPLQPAKRQRPQYENEIAFF